MGPVLKSVGGVWALLAFAVPTAASAADSAAMSLYGVELGAKPTVPMCPGRDAGSGPPCWAAFDSFPDRPGLHPLRLYFGRVKPDISKYGYAVLFTGDDGAVDMIQILTTGTAAQESVLGQLKAKFGDPIEETHNQGQTRGGLTFVSIIAKWASGTDQVLLDGVSGSLDDGIIAGTTERGRAAMDAAAKAKRATQPQL